MARSTPSQLQPHATHERVRTSLAHEEILAELLVEMGILDAAPCPHATTLDATAKRRRKEHVDDVCKRVDDAIRQAREVPGTIYSDTPSE